MIEIHEVLAVGGILAGGLTAALAKRSRATSGATRDCGRPITTLLRDYFAVRVHLVRLFDFSLEPQMFRVHKLIA
jgi:hypothetical protein